MIGVLKQVAHQSAREMVAAMRIAGPKVVRVANEVLATRLVLHAGLVANETPMPDRHAVPAPTADQKVVLEMKMVHHVGLAWDADRKGGLAVKMVRHVVGLVAPGCQVAIVMETPVRLADPVQTVGQREVPVMKMVRRAGRA